MTLKTLSVCSTLILSTLMAFGTSAVYAQQDSKATRAPETGLAILDCAPKGSKLTDSCLLRVPPGYELPEGIDLVEKRSLKDNEASFRFTRSGKYFPDDVVLSETIVLIDMTPGLNGGRNGTWARERALIQSMLDTIPSGEPIAVYGFNTDLVLLQDFTDSRSTVKAVIKNLKLDGLNTRISSSVSDAINILSKREKTLFRNIILITDGQDEGLLDSSIVGQVRAAAADAGVSVFALGMMWQREGTKNYTVGLDYLTKLTEKDAQGIVVPVPL